MLERRLNREIELKFELDPADVGRLTAHGPLKKAPSETRRMVSVYYDTPGSELRKRGFSLRVRSMGDSFVQTVKALQGGAGFFARTQWESAVQSPEPDVEAAKETPLGPIAAEALVPVVRTDINRTVFSICKGGSWLELDLDQGVVAAGDAEQFLAELEIELVRGRAEDAAAIARRIARRVPVKIAVLAKAERGFALQDGTLLTPSKAGRVSLGAGLTVAQGFAVIAQACMRQFRLNEPLVIELRDAEALHQARVAIRRLGSAFTLFKPALTASELPHLRHELRWFLTRLGDARNLDVFLKREDLSEADHQRARRQRERAYNTAIQALDSRRFRLLMVDLIVWIAIGRWRDRKKAGKPLSRFIDKRIDKLWSSIAEAKGKLAKMDELSRHHLRIRVKKLRYALEFTHSLHQATPAERKKFGKAIEALQDALGQLNDLVVGHELERKLGNGSESTTQQERAHLRDAGNALRKLTSIGPYWRKAGA